MPIVRFSENRKKRGLDIYRIGGLCYSMICMNTGFVICVLRENKAVSI